LAAFSVHALDYVMKPIDDQRFDEALDTARKRLSDRRAGEQLAGIRDLLIERADATARTWQDRFVIKNGSRTLWVTADEIDWIEASGDYAILHVGPRRHMIHDTMDGLEQRLDPKKFARIHRSTIVALDRLKGFGLLPTRDAIVTLKDGSELRVSRRYRHRLPFGREG
jgi:two-component system LytT family response regulator